jgi:hypothetical protein
LGFDVNLESGTVHRPIHHPGGGQFIHTEPGDKSLRTPMAKRRKLDGANRLPEIIEGVEFTDGIKQLQNAA